MSAIAEAGEKAHPKQKEHRRGRASSCPEMQQELREGGKPSWRGEERLNLEDRVGLEEYEEILCTWREKTGVERGTQVDKHGIFCV